MNSYEQNNMIVAVEKLYKYCEEHYRGETWEILSVAKIYHTVEEATTSNIIATVSRIHWYTDKGNYVADTGLTMLRYGVLNSINERVWQKA